MKKLILPLIIIILLAGCSPETNNNVRQPPESEVSNEASDIAAPQSAAIPGTGINDIPDRPEAVEWHDKAIEKMVRNALDKPAGEIFPGELDKITSLYIWGISDKKIVSYAFDTNINEYADETGQKYSIAGDVTSIEDLKLFINLKELTLCYQNVTDFNPLASLTRLETLTLTNNGIENISFIRGLKNLKTLVLDYNDISDMADIYSLDSLEYLDVSYNDITSIKGLENCTGLKTLLVDQGTRRPNDLARISDISPLKGLASLEKLSFLSQDIEDLTPVSGLQNLESLSVQDNDISDYTPLGNLKKLVSLKLKNYYINNNLAFLRTLPELKDTDISQEEWCLINFPFSLSQEDAIEGIYSGNIVNGGFAGYDGKYVYYEAIVYGDLGHPDLERFNVESNTLESISGQITAQIGRVTGQKPGDMINENVSFLNIYKGRLYFMGNGHDNNTADTLEDGSYYPGNDVIGLARMNPDGSDRIMLTKDVCSYVCVANDRIFCLNSDGRPVSMDLDGGDLKILLDQPCTMLYTDGINIFYQLNEKNKKLYCMKMDNSQPTTIVDTNCSSPIILGNSIYYLDNEGNICLYLVDRQQSTVLYNCKAECLNLNDQYIFYSNEEGIYRIDREGKNLKQIYSGYAGALNVIGGYVFFDASEGYSKIRDDGSEYNKYYEYF